MKKAMETKKKKMETLFAKFLLLTFILLSNLVRIDGREALEIGIGGGGGEGGGGEGGGDYGVDCPPPPPEPECPPPPPPEPPRPKPPPQPPAPEPTYLDVRLIPAVKAIKTFRKTIFCDPMGITQTWTGTGLCKKGFYKGFYCDNPPDNKSALALAAVDFNGYKLGAPSIAEFINCLADLAFFHANSNNFGDNIKAGIEKLRYVYEVDLSNNNLTGYFPKSVLEINNLTFLDLRFNGLQGSIPSELFCLKKVEVIFLNNNNFDGEIPYNLGNSPVQYLVLANNRLTGGIPSSIGLAKDTLLEVLLLNNQLSGCLPYEIGLLEKTTVFDAGGNRLTGALPFSLGCLKKMEQLNFAGNQLYGQIPEHVCKLGNLQNLSLSDNYFTAVGPICRMLIEKGVLDDRKNCILGRPNQRSAEECTEFFLMPMKCPYHSSFHVPCMISYEAVSDSSSMISISPSSSPPPPSPSPSPSPAYAALIKNR